MDDERLTGGVTRNISWLMSMLPEPDGSAGIWERLRLDRDEVVYWVRPDCTSEVANLFGRAAAELGREELGPISDGLLAYVMGMQVESGSFPFYVYRPPVPGVTESVHMGDVRFPNDSGKTLEALAIEHDRRTDEFQLPLADTIGRLADYLVERQTPEGWFELEGTRYPGPCFVSWPIIGLTRAYRVTGNDAHRQAVLRATAYLQSLQLDDGRHRTSFEVDGSEAWRPPSSETAEALRAYSVVQRYLDEDLGRHIAGSARFLRRLSTGSGAIRNCDKDCAHASKQRDPSLTDLVYTCGYGLHAWIDAWEATGDRSCLDDAVRLGAFLLDIQCDAPSEVYDGAWRGAYDVDRRGWRGRANQDNPMDEGGAHSVYTGWCNATISNGLLRLAEARASADSGSAARSDVFAHAAR
jgi:hypothetical protein